MHTKSISLQASLPFAPAWARRLFGASEASIARPSAAQREAHAALAETARDTASFGDCFVFGRCGAAHELALAGALRQLGHGDARTFWCVDGAEHGNLSSAAASYIPVDTVEFEARPLAALRQRHQVRSLSVVMVADDFVWSLGRVVQGLTALLATRASLLVAGQQAAMVEALWFDELRRGQHGFEVARMSEPASAWARFRLQRRHQV